MSQNIRQTVVIGIGAFALAWTIAGCTPSGQQTTQSTSATTSSTPSASGSPTPTPVITPRTEEDERPPVIISSSSVNLWMPFRTNRGAWAKVDAKDDSKWIHDYTPDPGSPEEVNKWSLQALRLNIVNGKKQDDPMCADGSKKYDLRDNTLTIDSGLGPIKRNVIVKITDIGGKKYLHVEFDGAFGGPKEEPGAKYWLRANGTGPRSVSFYDVGAGKSMRCELEGHAVLTVLQIVR